VTEANANRSPRTSSSKFHALIRLSPRSPILIAVSVVASSQHVEAATLRPAVVAIGRAISRAVAAAGGD